MLSIKKHFEEKKNIKKYAQGALPMEIYVGDYKYDNYDGCRYKVILGNADFSGCEGLNLENLQYVSGIVSVNDSCDINFALKGIGNGLIMSNNHHLKFKDLKEVCGDIIISDTFIDDMSNLETIDGAFCFNHSKIFNSNKFIDRNIKDEIFFEK